MLTVVPNDPSPITGLAPVPEIVAELRAGRMVVIVDDEDRENEGDLLMAAEHVTPEAINFMAKHGRGLICLTLTRSRCLQLGLKPMVEQNQSPHHTNFTVSIEAAEGVTTGISAADRARTVLAAVAKHATPADIVQPGHIFPLMAAEGGVLMRAGHTEAGCDFAALAGCEPAAVICEILKDDGEMARLPDLITFAREHGLKVGTIADLIHYRSHHESLIERVAERTAQTAWGPMRVIAYRDTPGGNAHLALVHGTLDPQAETLVRVHEPLSTLDWLDLDVTTHSWSIPRALEAITKAERGVLVLLNCDESADRLFAQFGALERAAHGDTPMPRARAHLRTYGIGAQILKDLGVVRMRLLAKPRKMPSMAGFDLSVSGYEE
ncbi:MAG TPA: bifunctional 3,4-dihydroxy-2-butanone-4-phosphate synthase/GTP cyclohydrolase II [Burkholderiaceae bacterium]|nr:bifunctional 3,4-dihydroxy-2-butanone-4-phosphate synthase/GTP cyclohydrolase II [Burkholderiaceae bacterium]